MKKHLGATIGAVVLAPLMAMSLAGPANAVAEEWDMPDLTGMTLAAALSTVTSAAENTQLLPAVFNTTGPTQQISNQTNWYVCYQYPKADTEMTAKTKVSLGVRRPDTDCWS